MGDDPRNATSRTPGREEDIDPGHGGLQSLPVSPPKPSQNLHEDFIAPHFDDSYDDAAQALPDQAGENITQSHSDDGLPDPQASIENDDRLEWEKGAVADETRCVGIIAEIFAAQDDEWLGKANSMATSMARTINTAYNGRTAAAAPNAVLRDPGGAWPSINLPRYDFLSLWGHNWLTDAMIDAVLTVLFPARFLDDMSLADTTRFNALVTQTSGLIGQDLDVAAAALDDFDPEGEPPFKMQADINTIVGVMNEGDMHWFA